jgi:hypothetical protein
MVHLPTSMDLKIDKIQDQNHLLPPAAMLYVHTYGIQKDYHVCSLAW